MGQCIESVLGRLIESLDAGCCAQATDATHVIPDAPVEGSLAAQGRSRIRIGGALICEEEIMTPTHRNDPAQARAEQGQGLPGDSAALAAELPELGHEVIDRERGETVNRNSRT